MYTSGEEEVQTQRHCCRRQRQHREKQLCSEWLARRGPRRPCQHGRDHVDARHDALMELPPPDARSIGVGTFERECGPGWSSELSQIGEQIVSRGVALGGQDAQAATDDRIEGRDGQLPRQCPGRLSIICASLRAGFDPKGCSPVASSHATTPKAKISVRPSISPPAICSGAVSPGRARRCSLFGQPRHASEMSGSSMRARPSRGS